MPGCPRTLPPCAVSGRRRKPESAESGGSNLAPGTQAPVTGGRPAPPGAACAGARRDCGRLPAPHTRRAPAARRAGLPEPPSPPALQRPPAGRASGQRVARSPGAGRACRGSAPAPRAPAAPVWWGGRPPAPCEPGNGQHGRRERTRRRRPASPPASPAASPRNGTGHWGGA